MSYSRCPETCRRSRATRLKRLQPSERVSYQREVAAVCEREICYLGYVEPPEVVVLCRRSINGISDPPLDEPDPQDESGLNDSDQFGPRLFGSVFPTPLPTREPAP